MGTDDKKQSDRFESLRARADQMLEGQNTKGLEPNDVRDVIHELRVHQTELEIQNEELRRSREETRAIEEQYQVLYESAPCGYLTLDAQGNVTRTNSRGAELLSMSPVGIVGRSLDSVVSTDSGDLIRDALTESGRTGETQTTEVRVSESGGRRHWLRIDVQAERDTSHTVKLWRVVVFDVTRRRDAESEVKGSQARLQMLSGRLQESNERQLSRFAHEIHDSLAQVLVAVKMSLSSFGKRPDFPEGDLSASLAEAEGLVDTAIRTARSLSAELRPAMLSELGIVDAVRWLLNEFSRQSGIAVSIDISPNEIALGEDVSTAIFRIIKELLANVLLHANAKHVSCVMRLEEGTVEASVSDDGVGILESQILAPTSYGLSGIEERTRYLGGSARFERIPQGGTRCSFRVPVAEPN